MKVLGTNITILTPLKKCLKTVNFRQVAALLCVAVAGIEGHNSSSTSATSVALEGTTAKTETPGKKNFPTALCPLCAPESDQQLGLLPLNRFSAVPAPEHNELLHVLYLPLLSLSWPSVFRAVTSGYSSFLNHKISTPSTNHPFPPHPPSSFYLPFPF